MDKKREKLCVIGIEVVI